MICYVEKHLKNRFFSEKRFEAEVVFKSKNSVHFRTKSGFLFSCLGGKKAEDCNPATMILPLLPEIFASGDHFVIQKGRFVCGSKNIQLYPDTAMSCTLEILSGDFDSFCITKLFQWLKEKQIEGMAECFHEECDTAFSTQIRPAILNMIDCLNSNNYPEFFDTLAWICDARIGLTPSCDDFICGLLLSILCLKKNKSLKNTFLEKRKKFLRLTKKKTNSFSWGLIFLSSFSYCNP